MTDDNFVNISGGKVQGFIQVNYGTVIQNFINQYAESYIGQAPHAEKLTQNEYRQRTVLLSKVKEYWIEGVLEKSLHTKAMIELGLEKRSDAVKRPFQGFEELPEESRQILPTGTDATEVFNQIGDGRTLLILGEPGSGKTITLLKLAQNLITRAEENVSRLIPVVFNLSSWGSKQQTIANWLIEELSSKYQVPKELGKDWVKNQQLLLLLDGLDEVKADRREACVEAINQFMQEHGQTEMVVCSRIADYEVLSNRLQLRGAIYIRSLTPEQVNQYLDTAGEQLEGVKTLLTQDTALQELAKSPLTLSVMTLAYQGKKVEEISQTGSVEERREHLFDSYIERMFFRRQNKKYCKKKSKFWLCFLAKQINVEHQSIFLIEDMQPSWLSSQKNNWIYFVSLFIIFTLLFAISSSGGIRTGIFYGLAIAGYANMRKRIVTVKQLRWSSAKARKAFYCLIAVYVFGTPIWTLQWLWETRIDHINVSLFQINVSLLEYLKELLFFVSIFWLFGAVIYSLFNVDVEKTTFPNQGIWESAKSWIFISIIVALGFYTMQMLFHWQHNYSLGENILTGVIIGLIRAGYCCIQHFTLRVILCCNGKIPWNYARFLNYATERIFLQKVGGGYIFVHRMLLEHFAHMK